MAERYSKQLHKQTAKVEKRMADLGADIFAERDRLAAMRPQVEADAARAKKRMKVLRFRLEEMIDKDNTDSDTFSRLKEEYFEMVHLSRKAEESLLMIEEAIAEAELANFNAGQPVEDAVTGPLGE